MPTILAVDDDPNVALLVKMTLSKDKDINIELAGDGDEALAKVRSLMPDLVLLDVMMPGMDGLEVCRRIKSDESTKYIPVIMLTAKREAGDMIKGMNSGANDYITKPFNPEELLTRIRVHLRVKALENEASARRELEAVLKMSVTLQHEINNPLQGVIGNVELLRDRGAYSREDIDAIIDNIYTSSIRIKEIIRQMSKVSRLVSTTYVGSDEMIDIGKSVGEAPAPPPANRGEDEPGPGL